MSVKGNDIITLQLGTWGRRQHQHHLASFCQSMVAVEIGQFSSPFKWDNTNFVSIVLHCLHIKICIHTNDTQE